MKGAIASGILVFLTLGAIAQQTPDAFAKAHSGRIKSDAQTPTADTDQQRVAGSEKSITLALGDAHLAVPATWKHIETKPGVEQMNGLLIMPPDNSKSRNLAILLMPAQELRGSNFPQTVDGILKKALAPNERLVEYSELPVRKAAGYDFLTRAMVVADGSGHRMFRICFSANPGGRLQMLVVSADSTDTLKHYESEISSVLNSYSFGDVAAAGTQSAPSPTPASPSSGASPERAATAKAGNGRLSGKRGHVPERESVLLCIDARRLDGAMDFAKYGDSYNALRALAHDNFFRVNGPASLEVKESELDSRWPKVFVVVLDGDLAGRTGWVVLSEIKDLKDLAK